ncbi:putative ABC transporter [Xylariaceae sp. FL1651]|nr:putative ABC transporter [Xylariaceae sp. FL1651]
MESNSSSENRLSLLCFLSAHLVFAVNSSSQAEISLVISLTASLIAMLGLTALLQVEQRRTFRPSGSVIVYLTSSILTDIALLTLPLEAAEPKYYFRPVLGRLPKRANPNILETPLSPEDTESVLGRTFFIWINPILLKGYRNILTKDDLPTTSGKMKPSVTRQRMIRAWEQRNKPETPGTLLLALFTCVKGPFLMTIFPRLFLTVFRYSQPLLIKESIKYVSTPTKSSITSYGYWLIVAALTIYVGLATSTAVYQQQLNRLKIMIRSALVGLIHHTTLSLPTKAYHNGNDGKAVTLMSVDVDGLDGVSEMFHETWAQVLEVTVGLVLLAREVGLLWPLPILLIFLCSHVTRYIATHLQPRQKDWNNATEIRIAALTSMLSSIKIIKMLGLQDHISDRIRHLRQGELLAASKVRWMIVYHGTSANALGILSPALTLIAFAVIAGIQGNKLDAETAFTTIAILGMVTHPANMVMTIVPRALGALAGFERIQTYLLTAPLHDQRGMLAASNTQSTSWGSRNVQQTKVDPAILIQDLNVGASPAILKHLHFKADRGSFTVISGPVASGKSTLLRAILGETAPTNGSISLSTKRIGYCAQDPWLPNGTIKEAITGICNNYDNLWYQKVVKACCLTKDFNSLSMGDATPVGNRGLNLSGGQRQRVALARALFSKCEIALLDDVLSGLDGSTEQAVVYNLFGTAGLYRQLHTTVILVSNSSQYFHLADQIVIMSEGGIHKEGCWEDLQGEFTAIAKFTIDGQSRSETSTILSSDLSRLNAQLRAKDGAELDLPRCTGDFSLYSYYFSFIGWIDLLFLAGCNASYSFFIAISQYWLELWTDKSDLDLVWFYVGGYILLALVPWISTSGSIWTINTRIAPQSGKLIHQRLLEIVVQAPLAYFSKTDLGSILNRFSQDIQLVDKQLPSALASWSVQIFKLFAQVSLLFAIQKWLMLSLPICMAVVYLVQMVYLRTSRQLRFLELESRAAVFSSFIESVEGLETLRAFGWRKEAVLHNISQLEHSLRPEFCLFSLQRWLNIVLDLLAAAFVTLIVAMAVTLRGETTGGQIGVALNIMLVANTTLLRLVENWTNLEISFGAISRLKNLETTPSEDKEDAKGLDPPSSWPSEGRIELKGVTAAYSADNIALRDISLTVEAGQKILVCGRTGSGKSSLLLTLLRMLDLQSGTIQVDGLDISSVARRLLRQRCFITVSQDALIFPEETLRFNLDSSGTLPTQILAEALTRTGLWTSILGNTEDSSLLSETTIFGTKVSELPKLSFGQSQLFALSRTLVRIAELRATGMRPILLLDEITAAVDVDTELAIHNIIDNEFTLQGHTVIMVAHRVGTMSEHLRPGRDAVMWVHNGRLESFMKEEHNQEGH